MDYSAFVFSVKQSSLLGVLEPEDEDTAVLQMSVTTYQQILPPQKNWIVSNTAVNKSNVENIRQLKLSLRE
jgi:hypothetical protein